MPFTLLGNNALVTDPTKIRQDITSLALHSAVADNKSAYNLPNMFIDQFEDDTGIATETNTDRNSSEYVSSTTTGQAEISYASGSAVASSSAGGSYAASTAFANDTNQFATASGTNGSTAWHLGFDFGGGNEKVITGYTLDVGGTFGNGSPLSWTFQGFDDSNMSTGGVTLDTVSNNSGGSNPYSFSNTASTTIKRTWGIKVTLSGTNQYIYVTELNLLENVDTVNATGTVIGNTQTASSSTTKVSGVMLYKDNSGTATIGTDLKIYFSCDNGSNWTEASSYGTVSPVFSTGVKMIRLGDTTCTAGTQIKYKAVWANQSSGSKETQLHGIGMNF